MNLTPYQRFYLASIMAYMKECPIPMREPGWEEQGYWGRPICQSRVRLIPDNPAWQILQEVAPPEEYNSVIEEYIAAPLYLPALSGLEFRLRVDHRVLDVDRTQGIERHHRGNVNAFPLARQKVRYVFGDEDVFFLECRNQTGANVYVASGLYGWHYYDPTGEISGSGEAMVDVGSLSDIDLPDPAVQAMEHVDDV